jgi:hypothetical protein
MKRAVEYKQTSVSVEEWGTLIAVRKHMRREQCLKL